MNNKNNEDNKLAIVSILIALCFAINTLYPTSEETESKFEVGLKIGADSFNIPFIFFMLYLIFLGLDYRDNNNSLKNYYSFFYNRAIEFTCVIILIDILLLSWVKFFDYVNDIIILEIILSFIVTLFFYLGLFLTIKKINKFIIISYIITSILFFISAYILFNPIWFWLSYIFSFIIIFLISYN